MDYDDNDFQSHNLHLAGEGSNKFPPVLQPYALPKFDFDDSLHGSLRFDSLVETEVFLGIENNEDNQWIEDYSRGTSGIQFSSSAAESCSISRCNNVWSEATSSESVEMLLKSVGQEDNTPVQTNSRESDACDELGCILKHMEPSLKQENNTPPKVEVTTNLQVKFLPGENVEDFSVLDNDAGGQQPLDGSSQDLKGDISADSGLGPSVDPSAISIEARQPVIEGSLSIDGDFNNVNHRGDDDLVNGSLDDRLQKGPASGMQDGASVQIIATGNDESNIKDGSDNVNDTNDDSKVVLKTDTAENQKRKPILSREGQMEDENPHSSAVESMEEANIIEINSINLGEPSCIIAKEHSCLPEDLVTCDQSKVDTVGGSLMAAEDNMIFERREIEDSNGSQLDNKNLANKCEGSHLSVEGSEPSEVKVGGTSISDIGGFSSLAAGCSSTEVVGETHAEGHVSSSMLAESLQICGENMVPADGKDTIELPSSNASHENDLIASRLQSDAASDNKSDGCRNANMVTCDAMDDVSAPSGDVTSMDAVIGHNVKMSPLSGISSSPLDKEKEIADKISVEASLSDLKTSSQVIAGLDPVSVSEEDASSGAARQMLCESAEQSPLMVDASKTEGPQSEVSNKVSMKCTKGMEVCPVLGDSTANKGNDAEVPEKENDEKGSSKVLEPTLNNSEMLGPISSEREECQVDTSLKGQKENEAAMMCRDKSDGKIAVPSTNDCGSCADVGKPTSGSPIVIRAAGEFQSERDKDEVKCLVEQTSVVDSNAGKALSCSQDPKQNDASKDERSFTFEVSPLANMPLKSADNKWQSFFNIPATKVSPIVNASPSASGVVQIDPKIAQDPSHGSPKVSDVATVRTGSKGTSERKTRRSSGKASGKESARKGNPTKETASARLEKGGKMSNVTPGPSGISQHVQSNEMQCYGHVDSSTMKPFVLASSSSNLPDLNSSVSPSLMFQQPFTDLQQVQLRAQIFVYGALIQGTAPDEAYMISAFGGSDGGKSIWENALRSSIERLHGQKPHLTTLETPLLSRPGARAPDQAIKQSNVQSKVISSPIGRTSMGTPTIVNPMVPLSSPLWSVPNPSSDTFQSSSMPRGPFMDHQRALSPLHLHQTPQIRNFAGNPWISQSPFCGPWVTSPQTLALDTSGRFSAQLPITEPVQLTPVKDLAKPITSGAKHVSPGPVVQSGTSASVFTGNFPVPDAKKVTASSSQPLTDPKPRKRKKASVSESPSQNILHIHPQTESVPGPVTSYPSTSIAMTTPIVFVSKSPTEKYVTSVSPTPTDIRKGDQNAEQRNILSEETLDKVKAARVLAEDAANLAAAAVSQRQEIWNQLDKHRNSGLSPDVETKLASAAVAIAAAAAVAKAAAAAANVASNAALQAKLMADEAVVSGGYSNPSQDNAISVSEGMESLGRTTPDFVLKGDDGTNSSSSILVAAREAARRRVEAASAAAIRAENMDAIVKAAELAAEAVSQAGKIVSMGDPLSLNELVAAGPEGYWEVAQINNELGSKSNDIGRKTININTVGEGPDTSPVLCKKETQVNNFGKPPAPTEGSTVDHARLVDGFSNSGAATLKDPKGRKGYKVSESEDGSRSLGTTVDYNCIKEGSHVEVFKDGNGYKAAWFSAKVMDLKDGKAYVSYTDLSSAEGSEKLKEWVALKGEGNEAPKIRIARPVTAMPFEGTRKRRRAAMVDYIWSVGDKVDAWIQDSWWEGVVTERSKKDETMLTVNFPVQGETSVVKAWHLRPSLLWEDEKWVEWSGSRVGTHSTNGGDTPQEKRPRVRGPVVDAKGKDKLPKGLDSVETDKPAEPTLLDLAAHEKSFNIGKSMKDGNRPANGVPEGPRRAVVRNEEVIDVEDDGIVRGRPTHMKYELRDTPGLVPIGLYGFQHYLSILGSLILIPLVIVPAMGGTHEDTSMVVSTVLFVSGVTTLLHTSFGSRLPLIQGPSFVYLAPALAIINSPEFQGLNGNNFKHIMKELQGAIIIASAFQTILGYSGLMSLFLRLINPVVVAPTFAAVGLSFYSYGFPRVGTCLEIGVVQILLVIMFSLYLRKISVFGHRLFLIYAVPLGLAITWAAAFLLTEAGVYSYKGCDVNVPASNIISDHCRKHVSSMKHCRVDTSYALKSSPWFRFPYPLQWGTPVFEWKMALVMCAVSIISSVDSVGSYHASSLLAASGPPTPGVVSRGIGLEGLCSVLAGLWGTGTGSTTLTENVHTIAVTKMGSRRAVELGACALILLSLIGKVGGFIASIPEVMVAALLCFMWAMLSALGLSNLRYSEAGSSRNIIIVGLSLFFSLSVPAYFQQYGISPNTNLSVPSYLHPYIVASHGPFRSKYEGLNYFLNTLLSLNMVIAFLVAVILDNTVPGSQQERGVYVWSETEAARREPAITKDYELPFRVSRILRWVKWVGF